MSRLLGTPGEPFTLQRAVDALVDSARQAGAPGLIWIGGWIYPSLDLMVQVVSKLAILLEQTTPMRFGGELGGSGVRFTFGGPSEGVGALLTSPLPGLLRIDGVGPLPVVILTILLLPLLVRVYAGLAYVVNPPKWDELRGERRTPRLRDAWRAGHGVSWSGFFLWVAVQALMLGAMVVVLGPVVMLSHLFGRFGLPLALVLMVPIGILLTCYGVTLLVVNQLALHSLVRNRRGVASAMQHAWRLIRGSPWAAFRAACMEVVLFASVFVLKWAVTLLLAPLCCLSAGILFPVVLLILIALPAFAGVTRAAFWARTYNALGGLGPDDRIPGLGHPEPAVRR